MSSASTRLALRSTLAGVMMATLIPGTGAQTAARNGVPPARLGDGQTPDFRGIWQVHGTAYVNIEGHPAGKGIAASKSIIVDPSDGKIPYKTEAVRQRQKNYRTQATADPSLKCYQAGVPRATYLATPLQILQVPATLPSSIRRITPSAYSSRTRGLTSTAPTGGWATRATVGRGHAGCRRGCDDRSGMAGPGGNFHSTEVHIVERYRLIGPDALEYQARIEDPIAYSMPWTLRTVLYRVKQPGARIIEDECLDDANGVRHHISPSDPRNLLKSDYSRWTKPAQK